MSTVLKWLGIIGIGAMVVVGISASEPTPSTSVTPISVVAPKTIETTPKSKEISPIINQPQNQ